eukprot:3293251-Heterocapsa_arctica.AAC.1
MHLHRKDPSDSSRWSIAFAGRNPEVRRWAKNKGQDDAWGGKPGAGAMYAAFSLGVEGEAALAE